MAHKYRLILPTIFVLSVGSDLGNADLEFNQVPLLVGLAGDHGGRLNGAGWNSSELRGSIYILMYVDPDKAKINGHVKDALTKEQYPSETIKSVGITNLAATWKPKFLVETILKGKQKKYSHVTYLADKSKVLVEQWGLHDHSYNVLMFSPARNVLANDGGEPSSVDVANLTTIIWSQISK